MQVKIVLKRVFQKGLIAFELPTDEGLKSSLITILSKCRDKNNDYVLLTLEQPKKPRTTGKDSQNHHLNGHIMQICRETGNDYDTVKNAIKMIAVEQMGYPYTLLHGFIIPKKESESSTDECAMLIEASHILAADQGIILQE